MQKKEHLFVKRLGNTEYGGLLPILGFSNDKKNDNEKNNEEGIGNIMNIFGDLGELHKLFEDTKSSTKSSSSADESLTNHKISDPKWLKRSTRSSTDNLDKYMLSNIVSNKDLKKITNLNNNKIIEIDDNKNKIKKNSKNNENKKNSKNNEDKKNSKNNEDKKNSKNKENNSEEFVNLYKKMNDVFSSMQLNKKK